MFAVIDTESLFLVRHVYRELLLDIHRMRNRNWLRDMDWVGFRHFDVVRHGVRYFYGHLNFIRHLLHYSVWDLLLHHNGVRFWYLHGVRLRDSHVEGDFDFIGDFLLDCDCVGFRDRIRHFLGDDYGPHVLLLVVLMFITAFQNPAAITLFFKTPLLQFSRTKYTQHPQQHAHLTHNNTENADVGR
jgi:hypothetical protein